MVGYPYLPGTTVDLADLGLKIAPPPAGPKVTLLGYTSNTGVPINEPLTVTNIGKVISSLYTVYPSGTGLGELAMAVDEASAAGAENIEVVVIGHLTDTGDASNSISPIYSAGQVARHVALSGAYEVLMQTDLSVVCPVNAWIDATSADFGKQLANFCHQASDEADSAVIGIIPTMNPIEWAHAYAADFTGSGSSASGLSDEVAGIADSSDYLFGLPSLELTNEWVKYVTQHGGPAVSGGLPTYFNNFLAGSEDTGGNFDPLDDESTDTAVNSDYFTSWQAVSLDGSSAVDSKGNKVDAGRRICVFAAPLTRTSTYIKEIAAAHGAAISNTYYNTNGAAAYAAMITTLAPQSSPTNKPIFTVKPLRKLSPAQANTLTARRLTTMHTRANGFVVTSAVTGAHNLSKYVRSDFVRLTTVRIVDSVINIIRAVSDKYIGEPNTASARNAMANEIEKFLKNMRVAQALNDWKMFISATPDQQVLGEATIDLTLVPAFELVKIQTNISLAKNL